MSFKNIFGKRHAWVAGVALNAVTVVGCHQQESPSLPDGITMADLPILMADPIAGKYDQVIDHASDIGTFKQRYWYSTQFVSGPDAPVIFYFCGEAPCSAKYVQSMADVAKSLGAAVVGLEHRYYGESMPFSPLTLDNMKYLTIQNALEDAAAFITFAKANLLLPHGKWLAAGGSYPGMLAAFFREKHPELVAGAWASSAPVNTQLSFPGYDMQVARVLPADCLLLFRQASAAAEAAYDAGQGDATLHAILGDGYIPAFSKADFMSDVAGAAQGAVQYGSQLAFCAALGQYPLNPLQGLIEYAQPPLDSVLTAGVTPAATPSSMSDDPEVMLATFGHRLTARPDGDENPVLADPWLYQVCTEVGFFQVHNPQTTNSIMSPLVNDDYYNTLCDLYVHQRPDVEKTRATYYKPLADGQVTNVLFVNGEYDPWSVLSFVDKDTLPAGLTSYVVSHGSHCTDLTTLKRTSLLGDFEVHVLVHQLATQWFAD